MKLRRKKHIGNTDYNNNNNNNNNRINVMNANMSSRGDCEDHAAAAAAAADVNADVNDDDDSNNNSFQFPFFDNGQSLDLSARSLSSTAQCDNTENINGASRAQKSTTDSHLPIQAAHHPREEEEHIMKMKMMMLSPIAKSRDSGEHAMMVVHGTDPTESDRMTEDNEIQSPYTSQERLQIPLLSPTAPTHTIGERENASPMSPSRSDSSSMPYSNEQFYDLSSAKKQVGESSSRFIGQIKSAARRRKVEVARSRDSLVAKEKEQLRSIAESDRVRWEADAAAAALAAEALKKGTRGNKSRRSGNGRGGDRQSFAGFGVPKVEKRPVTTPFSPLLGSRRKERITVKALEQPRRSCGVKAGISKQKNVTATSTSKRRATISSSIVRPVGSEALTSTTLSSVPFRARPAPSTTGNNGRAGQAGIPKVLKRPVTVPVSPCLGPKHRSRSRNPVNSLPTDMIAIRSQVRMDERKSKETPTGASKYLAPALSRSFSSTASSELIGLTVLDSPPMDKCVPRSTVGFDVENQTPPPSHNIPYGNAATVAKPFVPHSTCRANKRAEYDARRNENIQRRLQEERKFLQGQIKLIHRELAILRDGLQ